MADRESIDRLGRTPVRVAKLAISSRSQLDRVLPGDGAAGEQE